MNFQSGVEMGGGIGNWWAKVMSGPDNQTPAIGRYLALVLFAIFLLIVPAFLIGDLTHQKGANWSIWQQVLAALALYVPAISGSCIALIRVLNPVEPTHKGDDRGA